MCRKLIPINSQSRALELVPNVVNDLLEPCHSGGMFMVTRFFFIKK